LIVTVYSKNDCQPCKLTAKKLSQFGIDFDEVKLDGNPEAKATVELLGFASAPVVVVDLGDGAMWTWAGYRPSDLDRLKGMKNDIDLRVDAVV